MEVGISCRKLSQCFHLFQFFVIQTLSLSLSVSLSLYLYLSLSLSLCLSASLCLSLRSSFSFLFWIKIRLWTSYSKSIPYLIVRRMAVLFSFTTVYVGLIYQQCLFFRGSSRMSIPELHLQLGRLGPYQDISLFETCTISLQMDILSGKIYWSCPSWLLGIAFLRLYCYIFALGKALLHVDFCSVTTIQTTQGKWKTCTVLGCEDCISLFW